jgi:hypothetical protein
MIFPHQYGEARREASWQLISFLQRLKNVARVSGFLNEGALPVSIGAGASTLGVRFDPTQS